MKVLAGLVLAGLLLVSCTDGDTAPEEPAADPVLVDAAYQVCPMLWQWQLSIGAVMNDMSRAARIEGDAGERLDLYLVAMNEARGLVTMLREQIGALGTGFSAALAVDIETGLDHASLEIDRAEQYVLDSYELGDPAYNEIVPPIFMSFEKVIDLPKPEMATYVNPATIPSFQEIPQCQFGVKDVDDGVPRYVPLTPEPTIPTASG
jgi:hypothetical protein